MPKKFQPKKHQKYTCWWWFGGGIPTLILGLLMVFGSMVSNGGANVYAGDGCVDVKIIFARGSGEERWKDQNYLTFKREMTDKVALTHISYGFLDLDYPAISVANPLTLLTTFVSGGEAYDFGASINDGVKKLKEEISSSSCPNTKYVLAGYSQGAMVVSKALPYLDSSKIIYGATFGDPKLYLPEGLGAVPPACSGQNLSNYRIYVPDCRAYSGMLGGYNPYQTPEYLDKMGTWCNKADFFCSSYLSMRDHTSYVADKIYAEASKTIFDKIVSAFGIENRYISMHDTAILIDSTGSMSSLINNYKHEALALARETLENGGRVALYDYRDVSEGYQPEERCNFETCTIESFKEGLDAIEADGGGDTPESVLSAGLHVMKKLNWNYGATKSVVILTDADYHNPDIDGTTFDEVVKLSKKIDPVNFYIITPRNYMNAYKSLANATSGAVVSSASDLSILTHNIMSRFDSLPRVDDGIKITEEVPEITNTDYQWIDDSTMQINWAGGSGKTLIILNDYILGMSETDSITIIELDKNVSNVIRLVPLGESVSGQAKELDINSGEIEAGRGSLEVAIPKAPNTGKLF